MARTERREQQQDAFSSQGDFNEQVYQALRKEGSQKSVVGSMQTREELYHYLGYHEFEKKLDALFAQSK